MKKRNIAIAVLSLVVIFLSIIDFTNYLSHRNQITNGLYDINFFGEYCAQGQRPTYTYFVCEDGQVIVPEEFLSVYKNDPEGPQHKDSEFPISGVN